jgi:hypothetical protein
VKKILIGFCLLGILFTSCTTGNVRDDNQGFNREIHGELYIEKKAGFSMYIPKGWEIKDMNQKYLMVMGPLDNNFSPNINFGDEKYSGTISDYADAVITQFSQIYADFEITENENFMTYTSLQGKCIMLLGRLNEIHVRQRLYLIQNRKQTSIMVIVGTAGFINGDKYDTLFNECVKTFNWTK